MPTPHHTKPGIEEKEEKDDGQTREKITMKTNEEKTVWGYPYGVETEEKNKEVSVSPRKSLNIRLSTKECDNIS